MEDKYFWHVLGVFVGWILTVLASGVKEVSHRKQLLGVLLSTLVRIDRQLANVVSTLAPLNQQNPANAGNEQRRQQVINNFLLELESVAGELKSSIESYTAYHPLLAIELEDVYLRLVKHKNISTSPSDGNDLTLPQSEPHQASLNASRAEISRLIDKLAKLHGWLTYLRIRRHRRKATKPLTSLPIQTIQQT